MNLMTLAYICLGIPILICAAWFVIQPNPFALLAPVPAGIAAYYATASLAFRAQEKYDKENGHMGFDEAGFARVVEDYKKKHENPSP